METVIHCGLPQSVLNDYGRKIGELVKPDMDAKRYDHACSWLISLKMLSEIGNMSMLCKHTYTEITNSFALMTKWVNYAKIARCMLIACEMWVDAKANVMFDALFLNTKLDEYLPTIQADLCVFAGWAIYRGADGASIRSNLPTKIQKDIRGFIKKLGDDGMLNLLWRALVAYVMLTEKAIDPIYRKALKHGVKESGPLNSMASAFEGLKK